MGALILAALLGSAALGGALGGGAAMAQDTPVGIIAAQLRDQGYLKVHWAHNGKNVFVPADGLATLKSVNYITFDPMTIGQPHSHAVGTEEVWMVISGKNLMFLGKEIRWQGPGEAYKIPPNGTTPHSNMIPSGEPIRFLYFSRL